MKLSAEIYGNYVWWNHQSKQNWDCICNVLQWFTWMMLIISKLIVIAKISFRKWYPINRYRPMDWFLINFSVLLFWNSFLCFISAFIFSINNQSFKLIKKSIFLTQYKIKNIGITSSLLDSSNVLSSQNIWESRFVLFVKKCYFLALFQQNSKKGCSVWKSAELVFSMSARRTQTRELGFSSRFALSKLG